MPKGKRRIEYGKIGELFVVFYLLPAIGFYYVSGLAPGFLRAAYYSVVTIFVIQALIQILLAAAALQKQPWEEATDEDLPPVPRATFIVSAYLPNEIGVIEQTLLNILENVERPPGGLEVVLAYNTPQMVDIESRLRQLAYEHPELILANVYDSGSKSANVNYALELASGEIIVMLDADHLVRPDCLRRAWRWMHAGYDAVQGRCVIRNGDVSLVSALVSVEFEVIYGLSHFAKFRLFDTALFGGSNGYWRASVLKAIRFREDMLTEDIDATLRTLLSGHRIAHDRTIISTEEAPTTLSGLWFQRKRWSQGWFQCALKHQWGVLKSKALSLRARFIWTMLLSWAVIYDLISHLLWPILVAFWLRRGGVVLPMTPYIWFALVVTLGSGPLETAVACLRAAEPRPPLRRYVLYALMSFPYTVFRNAVKTVSIRDELVGQRQWVISARQ